MDYKVLVTKAAEEDFERCIQYLLFEKKRYRIVDDFVIVDMIFHELQDYENKMF
ncbi:MAG: hypothetical protein IKB07_04585 [Lachnospiraceae bacterium]|nr:hypothetical protein [Lachnospiraceae bacterium]